MTGAEDVGRSRRLTNVEGAICTEIIFRRLGAVAGCRLPSHQYHRVQVEGLCLWHLLRGRETRSGLGKALPLVLMRIAGPERVSAKCRFELDAADGVRVAGSRTKVAIQGKKNKRGDQRPRADNETV